jgi:hypothetical protein
MPRGLRPVTSPGGVAQGCGVACRRGGGRRRSPPDQARGEAFLRRYAPTKARGDSGQALGVDVMRLN